MERRYDELLTSRLEEVADVGYAFLPWGQLYRWYGVKKIAAGTYRDIERRWQEVSLGQEGKLMSVEVNNGLLVFSEKDAKPLKTND